MTDRDERSQVVTTQLIEQVRQRPGLYDKNLEVDRDQKMDLWKEVGASIYGDWAKVSKAEAYDRVLELQRKWRSVRDMVSRELRLRRQGKLRGRRPYKYFSRLRFLIPDEQYEVMTEDKRDYGDESEQEVTAQSDDGIYADPLYTKQKVRSIKKVAMQSSSASSPVPAPGSRRREDGGVAAATGGDEGQEAESDRLFLLSFAGELSRLPPHIRMWARAEIASVMQQAVASHYSTESMDLKRRQLPILPDDGL